MGRGSRPTYGVPMTATQSLTRTADLRLSRALARFSDDLITIPGTGIGIGADAVIGLLPGIGDLLGTGFSASIMLDAIRQRVPHTVLARMAWNMLLDAGLGYVPVAGDVADVLHRANRKNYRLLEQAIADGNQVATSVPGYLGMALALLIGAVAASVALSLIALWMLLHVLGVFG